MNGVKYQLPHFLARGLQFSWQNGEELANWTGTFNFTDDGAVKSGSDTGTRYWHRRGWLQTSLALCMNKCEHRLCEQIYSLVCLLDAVHTSQKMLGVLCWPTQALGPFRICHKDPYDTQDGYICVLASPFPVSPPWPLVDIQGCMGKSTWLGSGMSWH